jgi:hypothetical protein
LPPRTFAVLRHLVEHAGRLITKDELFSTVWRDAELARLHARLALAMKGRRQLVFVTGEPGIGKTSLVETFLSEIAGRDALLCRDARGEALVRILKQPAPTWLVELAALLNDRDLDAVRRRAEGATRERMLRELVEALDVVGADAPLVLLLEDLHWSDSATIDLLAMLARRRYAFTPRLGLAGDARDVRLEPSGGRVEVPRSSSSSSAFASVRSAVSNPSTNQP